jgi:paraquat-inducible protein B
MDTVSENSGILASEMQRIALHLRGDEQAQYHAPTAHSIKASTRVAGLPGGASPEKDRESSSASNSKAVLSALRSLQDKIRELEDERNNLQMCLRQAQEAKDCEEQQHRVLQRQLQLQLQESVKALTVRHETETEAIRAHATKTNSELLSEATRLKRDVAELEAEIDRLRDKLRQVEMDNVSKDEDLRRLRMSLTDLEAASVALKRVNERLEAQVAQELIHICRHTTTHVPSYYYCTLYMCLHTTRSLAWHKMTRPTNASKETY